jgi:hypothetical protein
MNETQIGRASHPSIIALAYSGKQSRTLLPLLHYVQSRCTMAERPTLLSWRSRDFWRSQKWARSGHKKGPALSGQPLRLVW